MTETITRSGAAGGPSWAKLLLNRTLHFFVYHLFFKPSRRQTRVVKAGGFELLVRPTVFHPTRYRSSEIFAEFVAGLDLAGKHVADVGTGSGILALAAARGGAAHVIALDINPNAARSASDNARRNGFGGRLSAVCSDLLAALAPRPLFDVIISNPPYFPGEPRDLADRAWAGGPNYRDVEPLFRQVRERLAPGGRMYLMVSSDSNLDLLGEFFRAAGLGHRLVQERGIVIESMLIFELWAADAGP